MSERVVLKSAQVSRDRKRFPTRCQKRYARCGLPPRSREPKTTSAAPRTIGSISSGTSAGSYSMSASWITAISPSAAAIAARIAAPLPWFFWRMTVAPAASAIAAVSSTEPSSTTITVESSPRAAMRSRTSPIVLDSLYAGMRKQTFTGRSYSPVGRYSGCGDGARAAETDDGRHDDADEQADECSEEHRVAAAACGRLARLGDLDDLRRL